MNSSSSEREGTLKRTRGRRRRRSGGNGGASSTSPGWGWQAILGRAVIGIIGVAIAISVVVLIRSWTEAPLNIEWESPRRSVVFRVVPELIAIQLGADVQDGIIIKSAGFRDTHVENMRLRLKQAFLVTLRPIFNAVLLADEEVPKVLCLQLRWVAVGVVKDQPDAMRYTLELSAVLRKDGVLIAEMRQKVTSDEVFRQRSDAAIVFTNAVEKAVSAITLNVLEHLSASP